MIRHIGQGYWELQKDRPGGAAHWKMHKSLRMPRQQMQQSPWSSVAPPLDAHLAFVKLQLICCYSNKGYLSDGTEGGAGDLQLPDIPEQLKSEMCCLLS